MIAFFYIFTAAVALFDLAEIKQKKEAAVYIALLIIMLIYSIIFYSTDLSTADYYSLFNKLS